MSEKYSSPRVDFFISITRQYNSTIRFGQRPVLRMADDAVEFLDYEITDADSYSAVLRGAAMVVSQLEPGPLRGHHMRVSLPGGEISWVETSLPLRGRGHLPPGVWTLSIVLRSASRSVQHGIEVRAGTLVVHRPIAEHDGIYGRDFSIVCLGLRVAVFEELIQRQFPELARLLREEWRVAEPDGAASRELVVQFEQAAVILRSDERVRHSPAAKAVMQDELLADFLYALADATDPPPVPVLSSATALVRRAEELVQEADGLPLSVADLCNGCGVARRMLSHAFQQVLDMGPATYLRRLRLNDVRRALAHRQPGATPKNVTEIALDHGFWHTSRFSAQYRELFGESPSETVRR